MGNKSDVMMPRPERRCNAESVRMTNYAMGQKTGAAVSDAVMTTKVKGKSRRATDGQRHEDLCRD